MPGEEESKAAAAAAAAAAEEKKELGNAAFASGRFAEAASHYTDAIRADPTNHIYYSNRSASYGSLSRWSEAKADATECLRLNPTFLKAYYRLAAAQIELNELDGARATIKRGLDLEPDNSQLRRQLRIVDGKRKDARRSTPSSSSSSAAAGGRTPTDDGGTALVAAAAGSGSGSSGGAAAAAADSSIGREIVDLRAQLAATTREYNITRANVSRSEKERQISELTRTELERLPAASDSKMYRSIGKMFLRSSRERVMDHLEATVKEEDRRAKDLASKLEYLEKRMKSQRQNIDELMRGGGGGGAITSSA